MSNSQHSNDEHQYVTVVKAYFAAFSENDLDAICKLFAENATVRSNSTNYRSLSPLDAYSKVIEMTDKKTVKVNSIAVDRDKPNRVLVSFSYDWTLKDKSKKQFPFAFDLFEMNEDGKIQSIVINLGSSV